MNATFLPKIALLVIGFVSTVACVSHVNAADELKVNAENLSFGKRIEVINSHDKTKTEYIVNGKRFTWQDLNQAQQSRLKQTEDALKASEAKMQLQEANLNKVTANIEAHAEEVEKAARKIEMALAKMDLENMTVREIRAQQAELDQVVMANERLMRSKEMELIKAETKLIRFDNEVIDDIRKQARAYEKTLIEIAAEL